MPNRKTSICFVTNELYPLGPGGIGRMLYNFAKHNEDMGLPADINFLVPQALIDSRSDARDLLESALDGIATVHICPKLLSCPTPMAQLLAKAEEYPWTSEWLFGESYRYYLGLRAAEQKHGAPFDIIEFPDFGGWGVASIEAKRAGLDFADTLLVARVHSTQGILYGVERFAYDPGHWAGIMFDAERHLFAHADLIVGHDPAIIDYTAKSYGLEARWHGRTTLEFPPVFINTRPGVYERADKVEVPAGDDAIDFIFGSRLQPVKRPDIFIRSAILFLESNEDYRGTFRLVCGGWDRDFVAGLKSLVPDQVADRIVFIEKASSEERLYYINRSIVVVPSDYESLCLFAFEAALAGRKVILNGKCPAFGNDFRWHHSENCLLFDGSVESLAEQMGDALSWRAKSVVEVVPSRPYWLDMPGLPVGAPRSDRTGALTVLCYGAQSPTEFNRHFDMAAQLEEGLNAAGAQCRFVFQLPRGGFVPGGAEHDRIRERDWELAFSSGNRECPEMFGRRAAGLGEGPLLLFPFGYEPSTSFVLSALALFRSDPSLSIVAGHVELVDPHSGRSDYIRVYGGEAPSTALLSSRIAPAFSLVNPDVLRRIPFDALAGPLWFEVFARTCALQGEAIAILPVVSGTLDSLLQRRRETTKRITAGLLDRLGREAGWQARLLSLDPVQVPADSDGRPLFYDGNHLRQIFRISPAGSVRTWEPVGWQDGANGVLIHPLDGEVTIGEVAGPPRRVSSISGYVHNVRHDNDGAEVAIALARSHVDVAHILQVARDGARSNDVAISNWTMLAPGASARVEFPCFGVSKGNDKILLMSRVAPGMSDNNAQIVFASLELYFNDVTIG